MVLVVALSEMTKDTSLPMLPLSAAQQRMSEA
jgi:hypothetical protein